MISARLVHRIEDHWEDITSQLLRLMKDSRELPHLSKLPEAEVRQAGRRVLKNLGEWLVASTGHEIARSYEQLGRQRAAEGIPLSEVVRSLQLMKDATLDFSRDQGFADTVQIFEEEELEHDLGRFFDVLVFHLVKGYEEATRPARHAARA